MHQLICTYCTHSTHILSNVNLYSEWCITYHIHTSHTHPHMSHTRHTSPHVTSPHVTHTHTSHIPTCHTHTHSPHQTGPKGVLTDFYRTQQEEQRKKVLEEKRRKELIEKHTAAVKSSAQVRSVCLWVISGQIDLSLIVNMYGKGQRSNCIRHLLQQYSIFENFCSG